MKRSREKTVNEPCALMTLCKMVNFVSGQRHKVMHRGEHKGEDRSSL